jgi:hypothetical protein
MLFHIGLASFRLLQGGLEASIFVDSSSKIFPSRKKDSKFGTRMESGAPRTIKMKRFWAREEHTKTGQEVTRQARQTCAAKLRPLYLRTL